MNTQSPSAPPRRRYDRLDVFFDRLAQDVYPEPRSSGHDEISRQAWERLQTLAPLAAGTRVLDVGCGQGVGLDRFRAAGLSAVGVTLSEEDLSVCDRAGHDARRMDQSFLEFSPGEFGLVWCRHCLEHSIAPFFTLTEFRRVLTPGGLLYVEVPAPDTACHHEWNPNHYSVLGQSAWLALLARAGFAVLDAFHVNHDTGAGPDLYFGFICRSAVGASLPEENGARLANVSLGFEAHGEARHLELTLDRSSARERAMIETLEAGAFYLPEVAYFLTNVLQPGDTMVEVGARVGYFSAIAGRVVGPSGAVYAFEPSLEDHDRLRHNLKENGLEQIQVYHSAVGAMAGSVEWPSQVGAPEQSATVEVVTLDDALAGLEVGQGPRLIRIDGAGSEYEILKGALRTLLAHEVPFIICAIDPGALERRGVSEMQLRTFMQLVGYQVALLRPDGSGLEPLAEDQPGSAGGSFNLLFFRA